MTPHRPLLTPSLLALLVLNAACPPTGDTTPPPTNDPPTTPTVLEWLLGDQVRAGGDSPDPGTNVGIISIPMGIVTDNDNPGLRALRTHGTVRKASCAPDLVQFIPIDGPDDIRFAINEPGDLLRYAGEGWSPVPSTKSLPPIEKLVASSSASEGLQFLVHLRDQPHALHLLVLFDEEVTDIFPVDLRIFEDRRSALKLYDSSRCVDDHDCLHPVSLDDEVVLMVEPELYDNHVPADIDLGEGIRDVRYADADGTMLDVLTTAACQSPDPSTEPSTEPETTP